MPSISGAGGSDRAAVANPANARSNTASESPEASISRSLARAAEQFNQVGACRLVHGFAQDIGVLLAEPVDVISASALLHEVYSYGAGYAGLHAMMRTLPTCWLPIAIEVRRWIEVLRAEGRHPHPARSFETIRKYLG